MGAPGLIYSSARPPSGAARSPWRPGRGWLRLTVSPCLRPAAGAGRRALPQGCLRLPGAGLGYLPGLWCVVPVDDRSG